MSMPSLATHVGLLWRLRLDLAFPRAQRASSVASLVGSLVSLIPAGGLALASHALVLRGAAVDAAVWPDFILRLLSFVTTGLWVAWPVLSAGVDDHAEVARYARFPISSQRLMGASMVAGLAEPRAAALYAPVLGATVGWGQVHEAPLGWSPILAFIAYVAFNAAVSRAALHAMLIVLRQPRSAELLGGGFLVFLAAASFIPPVDTSWLTRVQAGGVTAIPDGLLVNATLALGRVPSGFFAHALTAAASGDGVAAFADALALVEWTMVAVAVAWGLLLEFHRAASAAGVPSARSRRVDPFVATRSIFTTLVAREALDLWNNPRARLLASVPFVLAVLLKLLSARALFVAVVGPVADAWLVGALALYGAVVMTSTFAQNAFGYDGQGLGVLLAAPVDVASVLSAKNLVHGAAGVAMALSVVAFQALFAGHVGPYEAACAAVSAVTVVLVALTVGNGLSVWFPVKFHADLRRRDRVPFVASMLGVAGVSAGLAPWSLALRGAGGHAVGGLQLAQVVAGLGVFAATAVVVRPLTTRWLRRRVHHIFAAVTRW